jgi:hypothetical protein
MDDLDIDRTKELVEQVRGRWVPDELTRPSRELCEQILKLEKWSSIQRTILKKVVDGTCTITFLPYNAPLASDTTTTSTTAAAAATAAASKPRCIFTGNETAKFLGTFELLGNRVENSPSSPRRVLMPFNPTIFISKHCLNILNALCIQARLPRLVTQREGQMDTTKFSSAVVMTRAIIRVFLLQHSVHECSAQIDR